MRATSTDIIHMHEEALLVQIMDLLFVRRILLQISQTTF